MNTRNSKLCIALSVGVYSLNVYCQQQECSQFPNVIYIMADDLGIGDLGCYGQKQIKTPHIDELAATGMQFMQHYSGCTVSAPSRCSLITGKHTGHSYIRGNKSVLSSDSIRFDYPLIASEVTIAELMKKKGYATACIGKWGMGGPKTEGHPNNQGFDYFYGYLGQLNAHNYYPKFLYENESKVELDSKFYSHDLIMEKARDFIIKNTNHRFFLYLAPTLPHSKLTVPDSDKLVYASPQEKAQTIYSKMVSRLDYGVGMIMTLLKEKGLDKNTIVIFTSDNGVHEEGGYKQDKFNSNSLFRGIKRDLYEGGIRTPFIVNWPAKIKEHRVSNHVSAFWDFLPTICELTKVDLPGGVDGISYLPEIIGDQSRQKKHEFLYWEFHEMGGKQAVLKDGWKLIRFKVNNPSQMYVELYNLTNDVEERNNLSHHYPDKVKELTLLINEAHRKSDIYPFEYEK